MFTITYDDGLQHSINDFKSDVKGKNPKDVMDILVIPGYSDLKKKRDTSAHTINEGGDAPNVNYRHYG